MNKPRPAGSGKSLLPRLSAVQLLGALALLFICFPFIEPLRAGPILLSVLFTIVLTSAVVAVATRRITLVIAALLATPALISRWLHHYRPDLFPPDAFLISNILLVGFVIVSLLDYVRHETVVTINVVCAALSAYLLLGLLWTCAYWLIAERVPGAFSFNTAAAPGASMQGFDALYFSLITLNTVGYGDITPVAGVARMLAVAESTTGMFYIAVLIARLVSVYSTHRLEK